MTSEAVIRQRRMAGMVVVAAIATMALLLLLFGGGDAGDSNGAEADKPPAPPQLPGGGRTIFPEHLVVGFYGAPQARELGELGIGSPAKAGQRLLEKAKEFEVEGRKVLPAMELIAEIAHSAPGEDGLYRGRQPNRIIRRYLRAARKIGAILILDIQPGHASFFAESQYLEKWLREPDVSLALDPEWHTPGAVPGTVIGSIDVREVNAVSFWLDELVKQHNLPQKLLVVHRFTEDMIVGEEQLKPRENVAVTVNVDGFGGRAIKIAKYKEFAQRTPGLHNGFKLFFREDTNLLTPARVLRMKPQPELIVYE